MGLKTQGGGFVFLLFLALTSFYIWGQSHSIYGGDSGDLVVAAYTKGIAHPPGYPLYTFLAWLLTKLPWQTVAWRVTLLSSFFQALAVLFLYFLLTEITTSRFISLIGCLSFAFLYPVWLYASVAEVFALNTFFGVILLYLLWQFYQQKNIKYFYWFSFFLGLSLTHHHTIILLFPGFAYLFYQCLKKNHIHFWPKKFLVALSLFLLGLLPYLYLPWAALANPPVNWNDPVNFKNFFRLVTRADYGTFTIGSYAATSFHQRLLGLLSFLLLLFYDFRFLGLFLIIGGFLVFRKLKQRVIFKSWLWFLLFQFLFIFYLGIPLKVEFLVGTFERFFLMAYVLLAIPLTLGIKKTVDFLAGFLTKKIPIFQKLGRKTSFLLQFLFLLYPLGLLILNFPKISILKNDFTAEKFGEDILTHVDKNAVVIIGGDTALFNTQYIYYVNKLRPDVKLLHLQKLSYLYYLRTIQKYYPELVIPEVKDDFFVLKFVEENAKNFPVYFREQLIFPQGNLYAEGLLFRYSSQKLNLQTAVLRNQAIWQKLYDPLEGSLSKYKNLLLADVLRGYGLSAYAAGYQAFQIGELDLAKNYLTKAIRFYPAYADSYLILGQINLLQKKCQEAEANFFKALELDFSLKESYYLLAQTYRFCFNDQEKGKQYERLYQQLINHDQKNATPSASF